MRDRTADTAELGHNWHGKVLLWDEQALFLGNAADTSLHESPAIKICVALGEDFFLKFSDGEDWRPFASAIIAPGQLHAIDGRQGEMAMLVLVPEAELAEPLNPLFMTNGVIELSTAVNKELRRLFKELGSDENSEVSDQTICFRMMEMISADVGTKGESSLDPRVAKSIEWIRSDREGGVSVKEIAAGADLSESRFSHLFTENVRVPVRRYLLWLRLREAIHLLARGVSLTDSAYEAGFADSAHLTRTFRGMLGITPSALIKESSLTSFLP
jgi:AraC-like DNA-binding protein